jgi:DNA repair exonuclease SbcCD ATPase subunit
MSGFKGLRIREVVMRYFKGVTEITLSLGNGVTFVCGFNGSGKSSFLDGLAFALIGKPAFGNGVWKEITSTTGDKTFVSCVLVDENDVEIARIERKITTGGNESAKITMLGDKKFTQTELNEILSSVSLNIGEFAKWTPQKQALYLGIDTSDIDAKSKSVYSERTFTGRDVDRLKGAMNENKCDKPGEESDVQTLNNELRTAEKENAELNSKLDRIGEKVKLIKEYENKIATLKAEMTDLENETSGKTMIDLTPIEAKIRTANDNALMVRKYELYESSKTQHEKAKADYDSKTAELEALKVKKAEKIKNTELPFTNLFTDENGGLMIHKDDKDMFLNTDFISAGKLWEIVIRILATKDTALRTVIVKDASLLDEEKLKVISETAQEYNLQVLLEVVGEATGENSITLVEGALK